MHATSLQPRSGAVARRSTWAASGWLAGLRSRIGERSFWLVQAGVLAVTVLHWVVEVAVDGHGHTGLAGVVLHLPVILYAIPVAYAALWYGLEGGVLTGVWAAALSVPNIVVFHRDGYEWVGELLLVAVVVVLGAVVALPVERERQQRRRAEALDRRAAATGQRLALLNQVATLLAGSDDLDRDLRRVLASLTSVLDLSAAAVVRNPPAAAGVAVDVCVCHGRGSHLGTRMLRVLQRLDSAPSELTWLDGEVAAAGFEWGPADQGALVVAGRCVRDLAPRDQELLVVLAGQIGAAFETARLHHEEQDRLRLYVREATRAQEEERRRISRELHDVATHELLLVGRQLDELCSNQTTRSGQDKELAELRHRVGGVVDHLRRFSGALRPSVLAHLGVPAALKWLTAEVERRSAVAVRLEVDGGARRLPEDEEVALFRIAEEALRNVERHADATSAAVILRFHPDHVHLDVEDDGVGFQAPPSLEELARDGRLGLLGMRERAELAGASLAIERADGGGTRIRIRLPDDGAAGKAAGLRPYPCAGLLAEPRTICR